LLFVLLATDFKVQMPFPCLRQKNMINPLDYCPNFLGWVLRHKSTLKVLVRAALLKKHKKSG